MFEITIIEKFINFLLKYETVFVTFKNEHGKEESAQVPLFLTEINWNCDRDHLIRKWMKYCYFDYDNDYRVINFYQMLDDENRYKFISYALNKY